LFSTLTIELSETIFVFTGDSITNENKRMIKRCFEYKRQFKNSLDD